MVSGRKRRVNITPRARSDLMSIGRYTEATWGKTQRNAYLKGLEVRFTWLAENPFSGKHRTEVHSDYYSFPQGQHVVFYLITEDSIDVIGVLHQEMDVVNYFKKGQ